jgi:(p)ppGpp synthase/HD superfamily hydrolase
MASKSVITSAREFAAEKHGERQHAGRPLMTHLDEVAVLVREHGELHQVIAYLHHLLCDTEVTGKQIEEEFGSLAASCVGLLSGKPHDDPKEQRRLTYAELAKVGAADEMAAALVVKVADRLANVQDSFLKEEKGKIRKYRRDHRDFSAAVFRPGIADELWRELNELLAW